MNTKIVKIKNLDKDKLYIDEAGLITKNGGLVAFPTETVYGLGGDALNKEASKKIYRAKGRPSDNPLIVHVASVESVDYLVGEFPEKAKKLVDKFWPGPLTIILNKSKNVPYETTGGLDTVAIRMPDHHVALEYIKAAGGYVAAPSANTSGRPSPTSAKHVIDDLDGKVDMIIDCHEAIIGLESTIVDLTSEVPTILRPGAITVEMLESVIGRVDLDPTLNQNIENVAPKAPGMRYKHYAPKANLIIIEGEASKVQHKINQYIVEAISKDEKVGVIATDESVVKYKAGYIKSIGTRVDENSIAKNLYSILRDFDKSDIDVIYSESFSQNGIGQAIMNRLLKAAGYQIEIVEE